MVCSDRAYSSRPLAEDEAAGDASSSQPTRLPRLEYSNRSATFGSPEAGTSPFPSTSSTTRCQILSCQLRTNSSGFWGDFLAVTIVGWFAIALIENARCLSFTLTTKLSTSGSLKVCNWRSTKRTGADSRSDRAVLQGERDRKSTRLNSSHQIISYAVFCLQKKRPRPTP